MRHGWPLVALAAFTLLGFFTIPGHTYLQSDTQIYLPLLERLWDPSLYANELLIKGQHVSFTVYDEAALALRWLTGASFEPILHAQQLLFRFCALAGVYLLALAFQLPRPAAVFVAATFGLGAWVTGPSVLTFEYEPVPRGNAVGLTMLAIGLTAHSQHFRAGAASALAFLYQVPAVYPFWAGYGALAAWRRGPLLRGLAAMGLGAFTLVCLATWQTGEAEPQKFFTAIDAAQERIMRERASYNWVSLWQTRVVWHHAVMALVAAAALWRLRQRATWDLRFVLGVLLAVGLLSMPVSLLLLEGLKWSLIPQIQPARALLYVTALAGILAAIAGVVAPNRVEAAAWFLVVFALPSRSGPIFNLFDWSAPATRQAALTVILLAVAAAALSAFRQKYAVLAVFAAVPYLAIPYIGGIRNYANLHTPDLVQLSHWARTSTAPQSVFLFPKAGRALEPGIFRVRALRAVYVDWKGGGQVNYLRRFLDLWLPRWQQTMAPDAPAPDYKSLGIDYLVVGPNDAFDGLTEAYHNGSYVVYRTGSVLR